MQKKSEEVFSKLNFADPEQIVKNPEVIKFYNDRLERLQKEIRPYERVVKFALLPQPFSLENDEMTTTLKLRRNKIIQKYSERIDSLY